MSIGTTLLNAAAILVYDNSDKKSFAPLTNWIIEAENYGTNPKNTTFFFCANKCDLPQQVPVKEAKRFAAANDSNSFKLAPRREIQLMKCSIVY